MKNKLRRWKDPEKEISRLNELLEVVYKELTNKKNNSIEQVEEAKFLIRENT